MLPEPLERCRVVDTVRVEDEGAVYISVMAADIWVLLVPEYRLVALEGPSTFNWEYHTPPSLDDDCCELKCIRYV